MEENDVNESESVAGNESEHVEANDSESSEPSSMLEAIQGGLNADEQKEEAKEEEQKAEESKPEEVKPENEDEPPEGISKKAQERFRNLTHRLKEKDTELAAVRSDLDGIRQVMRDTGAKAEDFGMMFDYMKALNKGDMDLVGRLLSEQIKQYTLHTGRQLNASDPLQDFPDLRERVNGYLMDEQSALEIARQRKFMQESQREQQAQQHRQQSAEHIQNTKRGAMAEVDRMANDWAKRDPDYKLKEEIILKQIPHIAQRFPPEQWPHQVEMLYQTISSMPVSKPQNIPTPLRSSGQSGGSKQPANMLEALKSGLGYSA